MFLLGKPLGQGRQLLWEISMADDSSCTWKIDTRPRSCRISVGNVGLAWQEGHTTSKLSTCRLMSWNMLSPGRGSPRKLSTTRQSRVTLSIYMPETWISIRNTLHGHIVCPQHVLRVMLGSRRNHCSVLFAPPPLRRLQGVTVSCSFW